MSNYSRVFNFTSKDALTTGDPAKLIKGSEVDQEFDAVATAVNSKLDLPSSPVTGDVVRWNGSAWEASAAGIIQIGMVMPFAGSSLPTTWLWCDGSLVSTTTYASLFAQLSYTYGGSGSNFAVPDLRGRAVFGLDNMNNSVGTGGGDAGRLTSGSAAAIDGDSLGSTGGDEEHVLTEAEMPSHQHGIGTGAVTSGGGAAQFSPSQNSGLFTTVTGSDAAHTNMPPTLVLNYIIYAGV